MKLTAHLCLVLRLRMTGDTSLLYMPLLHAYSHFLKPVHNGERNFQNHCATISAVSMLNNLLPIFIFITYLLC
jgi:hypothetical protein